MARSKLRKTNSALSRGQMVRVENRFVLRLEEDIYDPDEIGSCCTENSEGEKCVCADNVTARDCCLQKGEFFRGISCDTDIGQPPGDSICECNDTGACCISCPNDPSILGTCVSDIDRETCTILGGEFFIGQSCVTNNPCTDDCPDPEPQFRASISCCRPCPDGTNTARNGTCTTYTGSGFSTTEAIENANAQCIDGTIVNTTTGSAGTPPIDPCSIPSEDGLGGFGGCPNCNAKKRPCCQFCDAVTDTDCEFTQSGDCYEVEVDFGGEIIGPGCDGALTNPPGTTDLFCTDDGGANACSGSIGDCTTCQEVCCCQDGVATPTLPENCTGPVIDLEPGQACDNTLFCELPFYCIECGDATCTCDDITVVQQANDPPFDGCKIEVDPKFTCQVVNTNKACPGFERPSDSDIEGEVACDVFGDALNPSANGGCGCGNCDVDAILACVNNDFSNLCGSIICSTCDSCRIDATYTGGAAGCEGFGCCKADGSCGALTP
mgnify:CR=1 FL=1